MNKEIYAIYYNLNVHVTISLVKLSEHIELKPIPILSVSSFVFAGIAL